MAIPLTDPFMLPATENPFRDSPGVELFTTTKVFSRSETFETWLMFRPTMGPSGAITGKWIPLKKVAWGWSGKGAAPAMTLVEQTHPSPIVSDTQVYPSWIKMIDPPPPYDGPYDSEP